DPVHPLYARSQTGRQRTRRRPRDQALWLTASSLPRSGSGYLWHPRAQLLSGALDSRVKRATNVIRTPMRDQGWVFASTRYLRRRGSQRGMAVHLVACRTSRLKGLERSRNLLLLLAGVPRCRRCRSWFVCRLTRGRDAGPADRGLGHRSLYVRRKRIDALVDLGILGARPKGSPPSSKPPPRRPRNVIRRSRPA